MGPERHVHGRARGDATPDPIFDPAARPPFGGCSPAARIGFPELHAGLLLHDSLVLHDSLLGARRPKVATGTETGAGSTRRSDDRDSPKPHDGRYLAPFGTRGGA